MHNGIAKWRWLVRLLFYIIFLGYLSKNGVYRVQFAECRIIYVLFDPIGTMLVRIPKGWSHRQFFPMKLFLASKMYRGCQPSTPIELDRYGDKLSGLSYHHLHQVYTGNRNLVPDDTKSRNQTTECVVETVVCRTQFEWPEKLFYRFVSLFSPMYVTTYVLDACVQIYFMLDPNEDGVSVSGPSKPPKLSGTNIDMEWRISSNSSS